MRVGAEEARRPAAGGTAGRGGEAGAAVARWPVMARWSARRRPEGRRRGGWSRVVGNVVLDVVGGDVWRTVSQCVSRTTPGECQKHSLSLFGQRSELGLNR